MKIAELFAQLGFKVEGREDLKAFETSMVNIANAARNAALALKILSRTPVPKGIRAMVVTPAQPGQPAPGATTASVVGAPGGPYNGPLPPKLGQSGLPVSVLQGLKSLGQLGLKIAGFATLAVTLKKLVGALTDMVRGTMAATFGVDKFTKQTGLSRQELRQWERVAALSDVSMDELHETLKQLQQRSKSIQMTGEGMNAFYGLLGISPHAKPTDFLKNFAEATKNMDASQAVYFGSQVGISENMVYMLRKNLDKLDQLIPQAELTDKQHGAVMELNAAWKELMVTLELMKNKLTADLAPAIKAVLDQITTWAKIFTLSKDARTSLIWGGPLTPVGMGVLLKGLAGAKGNTTVNQKVGVTINGAGGTPEENAAAVRQEIENAYYGHTDPRFNN